MAKHKKRDRKQQDDTRSAAEQIQDRVKGSATDQSKAQGSPADVARKHQRRFGHN
ncbi:hypothetical protein [Streptomyces sp. HNM0574]|uniref:hypothetical protein n=1 Tax=Streptomyces sp. HNM0574 TaxID=2714954 RepID=UPI00146E1280|nr:hypothetical protein [Streptomyces sp. HNM0574]NLU67606.1 hypothetical protein [Streptomyces sp. HNM0574]